MGILKKTKEIIICAFVLMFLIANVPIVFGSETARQNKKAVLFILDGITLKDLSDYGSVYFKDLAGKGFLGLMSSRTVGVYNKASGYLTIGSGNKASLYVAQKPAEKTETLALNANEIYNGNTGKNYYLWQTGKQTNNNSVVYLGLAQTLRENRAANIDVVPGLLGETLKENKLKIAVLGNADKDDEHHREAALIAMDKNGRVEEGSVGREFLKKDPRRLFGTKTDYERFLKEAQKLIKRNDFTVIDLGDVSRIDFAEEIIMDSVIKKEKKKAIKEAMILIKKIVFDQKSSVGLIMMVTPNPSLMEYKNKERLTPLILIEKSRNKGTLTSSTTRTKGIVSNTDIAPTILNYFGIKPSPMMIGRPVKAEPQKQSTIEYLTEINKRKISVGQARQPVLISYIVAIITMLIIVAMVLLFYPTRSSLYFKLINFLLGFLLAVPLTLLVLPLIPPLSVYLNFVFLIMFSAVVGAISMKVEKEKLESPMIICILTTIFLAIDVLGGSLLMRNSIMGFDPMEGARFYGIGNEYMGVLIGSSIIGLMLLKDAYFSKNRNYNYFLLFIFVFLVLCIGSPQIGANVGGAIAASAAYLVVILKSFDKKIDLKKIIIIGGIIFLVISLIVGIDLTRGTETSHAGRAFLLIKKEGFREALNIVDRKISMNLRLIQYTIWSKVLIVSLLIIAFLSGKPLGVFQKIKEKRLAFSNGLIGVIAGSFIALIFNDSGVVAAATTIIFAAITLVYGIIKEKIVVIH
ncbi:MAG: hypothetical protein HY776_08085 [Actinobacteria bacterium]|nr:hypothetical protein [Actinomycetota bacterium]